MARRRRRPWTTDEKCRIVDESLADGASIAEIARQHDLNANQLFTWRRQFGVETVEPKELAPFLPVSIASEGDRILVWSDVETAALTRVLKALARR